jgi:hypothetical protein
MNTQPIKTIPVFATYDSIEGATSYGMKIAHSMGDADKCAMITGLMVLFNTMGKEINALNEELNK